MAPKRRIVRPGVEREVEEEMAFHLEMRIRELVEQGMAPEDARAEALRRFGDIDEVKADLRHLGKGREKATRRRQWWDDARQDLGFALRQLRRSPAFAAVATLTLALAMGANTAVFTVVQGVLLKPLPYAQPNRLAAVWTRFLPPSGYDIPRSTLTPQEVLAYQGESRAFWSIGAFVQGTPAAITGDGLDAQQVGVWRASASLLPTLGVKPDLGRWFTPAEDTPDGPAVTVLTHGLWSSRYGSDPDVVGRSIVMNGVPTEVIGVLPAGFGLGLGESVGAYTPTRLTPTTHGGYLYGAIGRLAPGASLADVDAELAVLNQRWTQEKRSLGDRLWAAPLKKDRLGDAPDVLLLLLTAVGLVLLVACVNVANLLLARGERRVGEVALRAALGAGRGRIVRQLLTESLVLSAVASALALPLAWAGTKALVALDPAALPRLGDVRMSRLTLAFTLGLTGVTSLLFGVGPAVLAGGRGAASPVGSARRILGGRRRGALRRTLVTGEVAVSLVVVILAGLLVRSFRARVSTSPGFHADDVLTFDLTLPPSSYPEGDQVAPAYQRLLGALGAIPGAASVSGATAAPLGRHMLRYAFWIEGRSPRPGDRAWDAVTNFVMPGYFETLGIQVSRGRTPTAGDDANAPAVGVINETMARTYWPGENALGKRWHYGPRQGGGPWITVVGVVPDQIRSRVGEAPLPEVYLPMLQTDAIGRVERDLTVTLRAAGDPTSLGPAVRSVVKTFDPDLPVSHMRTMEDALGASVARPRLTTDLLSVFATLALLLAVVGLYGVVSYSVAGRTREIGVRVALGAHPADVVRLITREGAWPTALGVALGLGGAWLATRLVATMLYGVAPTDATTFTVLPLGLLAVAFSASMLPALRATRIEPTEALRDGSEAR